MVNEFVYISEENINTLLQDLQSNIPDSIHAYCFMKNMLKWRKLKRDLSYAILAPGGDFSDCTFLIFYETEAEVFGSLFSLTDQGCIRLRESLLSTTLFPWNKPFLFTSIPDRMSELMRPVWEYKRIQVKEYPGTVYWLPREKLASLDIPCPADVYLAELSINDAEKINSVWPYRNEHSVKVIRETIELNPGLGLYKKDTKELVSWVVQCFYGGVGMLQTDEKAKGKGYGSYVTASITKRLAEDGWPIQLTVVDGNTAGHALFNKIGFLKAFHDVWLEPLNCTELNSLEKR